MIQEANRASKEEIMEKFAIGMLIGVIGGALLTANNYKMRTLVKKSQAEIQEKLDSLMDEKLKEMEENEGTMSASMKEKAEEIKEKAKEKAKEVKDAANEKLDEILETKPKKTAKRTTS
jgi:DNA anti-recombination protein RmuC